MNFYVELNLSMINSIQFYSLNNNNTFIKLDSVTSEVIVLETTKRKKNF